MPAVKSGTGTWGNLVWWARRNQSKYEKQHENNLRVGSEQQTS